MTDSLLGLRPGVTKANAKRIKAGMALREVEVLLGGPPRAWNATIPSGGLMVGPNLFRPFPQDGWHGAWIGDEAFAVVYFDLDRKVKSVEFCITSPASDRPLDRLRKAFNP